MSDPSRRHGEGRPLQDAEIDGGPPSAARPPDRRREPTVPIRPAAEETLDEVETYLQELFGRYGLGQSPPVNRPPDSSPSPGQRTDPIGIPPSTEESRVDVIPLRDLPDPKRPPERRGDILALRELSTKSARGAIAQFDKGRIVAATWARFWLCFAALGLTLFFLRAMEPFTVRTLAAAAVAMVLAVYWCGQFWLLTRQATRIGKKRSRKDAVHAS